MKAVRLVLLFLAAVVTARGADADDFGLPFTDVRFGSLTFYSENDKYFAGTDQHYTNGFKVTALSADLGRLSTELKYQPVQSLARRLRALAEPGHSYRFGVSLGQNLYTPVDIHTNTYQPGDRPYAAWLYVGTTFQVYHPVPEPAAFSRPAVLDTFEVNLGMVGPAALGRQIQNGVHDIIGVGRANGWAHQVRNEPGLVLTAERKWRFSTVRARTGWGADFIPHLGATAGNIFTHASAGAELRLGWRLPEDFGTSLIRPSGDSNANRRAPLGFFAYTAWEGRAVAHNLTLDGSFFRSGPDIPGRDVVQDFVGGIGIGTAHWQFVYSQARRGREFKAQSADADFGSISLTFFR
jgi:hypothetical protein